ncbi:MAG: hypothetical protein KC978_22375 [Candidatus Omnitrophica bacterium]|nr:hypothetical protein [Candidatus Omnitrophota bacterium]
MTKIILSLLVLLAIVPASFAQRTDEKDLLLFGKAWLDPSDYAWSRESFSRLESDKEPGASVRDVGRLRIRFIKIDGELLGLDIRVLSYRYEAKLQGKKEIQGVSELEGTRLPPVWLHPALGFSVSGDSETGIQNNVQTGEIFELIDFRGFVPRETPVVGEEWSGKMVRKPDEFFRFKEERERKFTCVDKKETEQGDKFKVEFHEILKVTSMESSRSHELCETDGYYWVLMPQGLVETVSWESVATEYKGNNGGGPTDKVETRTVTNIVRRDPPPPKTKNKPEKEEATHTESPLPPR